MECKDKGGNPACKNENDLGTSKPCTDGSPVCLSVKCKLESISFYIRGCAVTVNNYLEKLSIEGVKVGTHSP